MTSQASTPRQAVWPSLLILVGAAAVLLLAAWVTRPNPNAQTSTNEPLAVIASKAVQQDTYQVKRTFIGRVEAARESRVGFEIPGQVASMNVDEGDRVEQGQPLAKLDTARLNAQLAQRRAALHRAEASANLAESTFRRIEQAIELDAVSSQSLDEAKQGLASAEAAKLEAEAGLLAVEVDISKSSLSAPFEALVAQRFVDEGEVVSPGSPVLTLLESRSPRVRLSIPSETAAKLKIGQGYTFTATDTRLEARLLTLLPSRKERTRGVVALFELEADLGSLRQGDLASLDLAQTIEDPGFWLPLSSLTESSRGLWSCYAAEPAEDGYQLARRELELLHQTETHAFVRGTLRDDELVVLEGLHRLTPGMPVTVTIAAQTQSQPFAQGEKDGTR